MVSLLQYGFNSKRTIPVGGSCYSRSEIDTIRLLPIYPFDTLKLGVLLDLPKKVLVPHHFILIYLFVFAAAMLPQLLHNLGSLSLFNWWQIDFLDHGHVLTGPTLR